MDVLTLAGFSIVMAGGNAKRETGWQALCTMLVGVAALHFGAVAVVVSFDSPCQRVMLTPEGVLV